MKKVLAFFSCWVLLMVCGASSAQAHRVNIFAWVDGDTVYTQSKFSGGKLVSEGRVNVYDPEGNQLLEGTTDDKGEFSFIIPGKTALKIELLAGMGHQAQWIVQENEISSFVKEEPELSSQPETVKTISKDETGMPVANITREELQKIVEDAVEKKLKPVLKNLADQSSKGPGIPEIIGGVGYIIGLAGMAAYFKSRNKKDG